MPQQPPRRESSKTLKDADGKIICSCGCGQYPQPPRRNWFSNACVHEWRIRNDPAYAKLEVFKRDKGICALCGCDAYAEWTRLYQQRLDYYRLYDWLVKRSEPAVWDERRREWVTQWKHHSTYEVCQRVKEVMGKHGFNLHTRRHKLSGWEADHIVPVAKGGGQCGLDNYRTLCTPCHKRVTAQLKRELAEARRQESLCS